MSTASSVLPLARQDHLVTMPDGDDIVIYDTQRATLHRLGSTMTSIWQHCDGAHSAEFIAHATGLTTTDVAIALTHLSDEGLLSDPLAS